jgi:probable HAF family extracellular repeat protein
LACNFVIKAFAACMVMTGSAWGQSIQYSIQDLGGSAFTQFTALGINNNGQVAGTAWSNTGSKAYLWTNGSLSLLGGSSSGAGLNASGQVVGAEYGIPNIPFVATVWSGSSAQNLNPSGVLGNATAAYGINDQGVVVGYTGSGETYATLWSGGSVLTFGQGVAQSINNSGAVTGYLGNNNSQAFRYQNGSLSLMQGAYSGGQAINDQGVVAGGYRNTHMRAFTWDGDTVVDLGTLSDGVGGYGETYAYGINNAGQVVGSFANFHYSDPANPQAGAYSSFINGDSGAFISDSSGMRNLIELVDPTSGWLFFEARGINDSGQIIVNGMFSGTIRSALLTPISAVPEPATYALLLAGLGLVAFAAVARVKPANSNIPSFVPAL